MSYADFVRSLSPVDEEFFALKRAVEALHAEFFGVLDPEVFAAA